MDRLKQLELGFLALGWLMAVMFQFIITDAVASYFKGHSITNFSDELLISFLVSFLIVLVICLTSWGRFELEIALIISVPMAIFIGFWPYFCVKGQVDWGYPIFFVECAPLCGLLWKLTYRWLLRVNVVEDSKAEDLRGVVKEVIKVDNEPKATGQGQIVVKETEGPKKEDKPADPPLPKPPAKPVPKAGWDLKI